MTKKVAVIGAGPAGCACAYFLDEKFSVTLFESKSPLHSLLYTGGGRCNLAYGEFDFIELAKNYPRGEKFLYSVFSKFATAETLAFFDEIGVETYMQDDFRFFPSSNSAKEVREKMLQSIRDCKIVKERVLLVDKAKEDFFISTEGGSYHFDYVVVATGGKAGYSLAQQFSHKIIEPRQALVGLVSSKSFAKIAGVSLREVSAEVYFEGKNVFSLNDDLLFTHKGISGPLAYKISSLCARFNYNRQMPIILKLNFLKENIDLQGLLNSNPKKDIKNLVSDFVPKSLAEFLLDDAKIALDEKCCNINGVKRDLILKNLEEFEVVIIAPAKEGEVVTAGGICLDEVNPKTLESKLQNGLYFVGEVLDVDGFCGGFNLQNCWSTGYLAAQSINSD